MRKLLVFLICIPLLGNAQGLKNIFKYSTFYAAVNGGTSLGDDQVWSVTSGTLQEQIIETPFDYTFSIGIRKIKRFGYENRALTIGYRQTISQPYIVARMTEHLISHTSKRGKVLNQILEIVQLFFSLAHHFQCKDCNSSLYLKAYSFHFD